jgi:hypothetical protein
MGADPRGEGGFAGFLRRIFPSPVAKAEVRAEIWRLGERHRGWPLEGALAELKEPGLPVARAMLLRACVQQLKAQ